MDSLEYLNFQYELVDNKMKDQFISQASGMNLGNIIRDSKGLVRPVFHRAMGVGLENVYLVLIVSSNDGVLIELAKKHSFPRGFPILWIPGTKMQYFGFYPKFSNDERQTADDLSEFDHIESLSFFKKWSGFLGQLLVFAIGGRNFWTIASKNSAMNDSPFIADGKRLFEPFIADNIGLIDTMVKEGLHICAEIISANDQVHGSSVINESPIVTAIGKGKTYDLTKSAGPTKPAIPLDKTFVEFLEHEDLVNFCVKFGLPCDSAIIINNVSCAKQFMEILSQQRDFMTNNKLDDLVQKFSASSSIIKGTVDHGQILGDCLEGLVIKLCIKGKCVVKKYKFAPYTIRTLLLREVFNGFVVNHGLLDKANEFVNHWCVSEDGKDYWFNFALECFMLYTQFISNNIKVGTHIQIAERLGNLDPKFTGTMDRFKQILASISSSTIIICVGPIGSGKTTFANELAKQNPMFEAIDGDELDLGMDITLKLSKERTDYSKWKILEILMKSKIPVISAGGGILFGPGKKPQFALRNQISSSLGLVCQVIVCVAGDFAHITPLDNSYDPSKVYTNTKSVKNAVVRRLKMGEWKMDPKFVSDKITQDEAMENFAEFIAKKSVDNSKFASALVADADYVFGYPIINSNNFGIQTKLDYKCIIKNVQQPTEIMHGRFGQIRLLAMVNDNTVGHITWLFDFNKNIRFSLEDFKKLKQMYPETIDGNFIEIVSDDGKNKYTFAIPKYPIHEDGSTHITIDSGNHAPKETGTIVRAMTAGEKVLLLQTKNNKTIKYNLEKLVSTPCTIRNLGSFGI